MSIMTIFVINDIFLLDHTYLRAFNFLNSLHSMCTALTFYWQFHLQNIQNIAFKCPFWTSEFEGGGQN
jgi:hypothetical protein